MQIICEIVKQTRKQKQITTTKLASGLCHRTYISHDIETKGKVADKFLFDAILQRLGINIQNFEHYVFSEDIYIQSIRIKIFKNLDIENIPIVEDLLEEYQSLKKDNIHQQFIEFIKGILLKKQKASIHDILNQYKKAINITLLNFENEYYIHDLLFTDIETFLLFEYSLILHEIDKNKALHLMVNLHEYLLKNELCNLIPSVIQPKLIYLISKIHYDNFKYSGANCVGIIELCDNGIKTLCKNENYYYLAQFLEMKLNCIVISDYNNEDLNKLKSLYDTFNELYNDYFINPNDENIIYSKIFLWQNYVDIGSVIKNRRNMLGLSQQQLADEVCDIKTVSRIENTSAKPNVAKTELLLEKLNLSKYFYSYSFVTSKYEILNLVKVMTEHLSRHEYVNAEEILVKLKKYEESKNNIINVQFIKHKELLINNKSNEFSKELLNEFISLLEMTISIDLLFKNTSKYLTKMELNLINNIISSYSYLNDKENVLKWINMLEDYIETSNMKDFYFDGYTFSLLNISSMYGNLGYYDKSNNILSKLIKESIENCCYDKILKFLYHYTWNFSNSNELNEENSNILINYAKKVYILADFKDDYYSIKLIRNLINNKLNLNIEKFIGY